MEKESMFYGGNPKIGADPRLISIPNLCQIYDVLKREEESCFKAMGSCPVFIMEAESLIIDILRSRVEDSYEAEFSSPEVMPHD